MIPTHAPRPKRMKASAQEFAIGLLWDAYTPRVESKVAEHLIALNDVYRGRLRAVVVDDVAAKRVKRITEALRIPTEIGGDQAKVWSVYVVNEQPELPEHAETAYYVNIGQPRKVLEMHPNDPHYPVLYNKNDERYVPPRFQLNLQKTPPRFAGWDPMRFWRFGI